VSDPTPEEINTQVADALEELGAARELSTAVLQAIDAAGYELTPKAGGSALAATSSVTASVEAVEGRQGWYVVTIGGTHNVLEIHDAKTGDVQRLVLS